MCQYMVIQYKSLKSDVSFIVCSVTNVALVGLDALWFGAFVIIILKML